MQGNFETSTYLADSGLAASGAAQSADGLAVAARTYDEPSEHTLDCLRRLDLLLRRAVGQRPPNPATDYLSFAAITDAEIDRLLTVSRGGGEATEDAAARGDMEIRDLDREIQRRATATTARRRRLPLQDLARIFGLDEREIDIVVACLAPEVDRKYERIYGYLHDDMSRKLPSAGLLLALFEWNPARRLAARAALFNAQAPLLRYQLLHPANDTGGEPFAARPLRIDERIMSFLLGDATIDGRVAAYVTRLESGVGADSLTSRQRTELDRLIERVARWMSGGPVRLKPVIYLHGARNAGMQSMVREAARRLDVPLLAVDAELLCEPSLNFDQTVFLLLRESLLSQAALFLQNVDRVLDQDRGGLRYRALARYIAEMGGLLFMSGERPWHWALPPEPVVLRSLELRPSGFVEQIGFWRALIGTSVADADLHKLVSRHPLAPGAINAAWHLAGALAELRGAGERVTIEDIEDACRAQARVPSSGLARRVESMHDWDDIVLPGVQLEQLRAICSQAKHLSTVYGAWGFERKLSLGKGLNALFSGPPGTGKTMAAEVIAADLEVEMLKIDLSQIVSKYIGETEKNLRQLFEQAAEAHAILFFDEADALLGKRSEVKDAHDRYANTEVAYLLQKMEEYEGITILATNLRQNMDEAFTRRMRFIVEFPFPEEDDRLRIWTGVWPKEVPLAPDVDLPWLARRFRLSGGNIRNVALAAAFLAAEQSEPVTMRHLMHATKRELQKIGRLVVDEEYRKNG